MTTNSVRVQLRKAALSRYKGKIKRLTQQEMMLLTPIEKRKVVKEIEFAKYKHEQEKYKRV